ncbi:hypothetical protein H6G76_33495 [Nostoc sp. FACHB-152]|uniref:hypothetical protein n=1 Tax=unclassified Nostoc TaxID=2593658 RepID=UPI00168809B7|nr:MULTISPECIES: hypothetical protein [unclassified Nostoc]MBD2451952.1 hypothetical protein [Nostoc sp. FACHB-152]MBD2473044.1 hypothetical protein [Nostoc sp. FACHB-145]
MKGILKNVIMTGVLMLGALEIALTAKPAAAIVLPAQRLQFALGTDTESLRGYLQPESLNSYVFKARAGQQGSISVSSLTGQPLTLSVFGVDGTRLTNSGQTWIGQLPASEDYFVRVTNQSAVPTPYTLGVTIFPLRNHYVPQPHTPFVNF